jgi:hypothetical protein
MDSVGTPKNFTEAVQAAINEALKKSNLVTKIDLKEFKDEMYYEMKCVERRMTLKSGIMAIAMFALLTFNNKL